MAASTRHVFINCPFDDQFAEGFRALVFAVTACGFQARCAREMDDASETRIDKLLAIIEQSRFGIHDLSRTELDQTYGLPRFNMPLELGLFVGAKRFGDESQKKKRALVMDTEPYRFQRFMSDIAGMDVTAHGGEPRRMVQCTRDWLATVSKLKAIPPPQRLLASYDRYQIYLPAAAVKAGLNPAILIYPDYERLTVGWVRSERALGELP